MGSRAYAVIHIGGVISEETARKLVLQLKDDGLNPEYGQVLESVDDLRAYLNKRPGPLAISDDEARGAMFEELENWLEDHKVSFKRFGAGLAGEWGPEVCFYEAGDLNSTCVETNDAGVPQASSLLAHKAFLALCNGDVHTALTLLEHYKDHKEPPAIPALEIK